MPVYAEASIFDLGQVLINGGCRGLLVRIDPNDLRKALKVTTVHVAI
jgi:prolyl-tRNA editing enzyme YbaK/EbsC (Cys-tRNA(Pro) deacylase)